MDLMVCVGGGGQHIALAVARMVRLGVWTNIPRMLVVDADLECPLAQRLRLFGEPGKASPVPHPVRDLKMVPPLATGKVGQSFRSAFLPQATAGGGDNQASAVEEELYELFYGAVADDVDIHKGMAAQPAVGAAVFSDLGIEHLRADLEGPLKSVERILVAASFIGGTGAGVTHELVRFLADSKHRKANQSLFGAFLLQWLQLPAGGKSAATDLTMNNSASHGLLHFLNETAPRFNSSVLVGANDRTGLTPGNDKQDESVSAYPLLAAYGLSRVLSDSAGAHVGGVNGENIFTLTSPGPQWSWLLTKEWNSGGAGAKPSIATRWAAARVVETIVGILRHPDHKVEFLQLTGDAFRVTGLAGFGERENWGTAIRRWAKKKGLSDVALAAQVHGQLEARMTQLGVVTQYLNAVFGDEAQFVLGAAGGNNLQSKYQSRERMTKAAAYGYLAESLKHRKESVLKVEDDRDAAAFIAEMMEEALMEEVLKGEVRA